MGKPAPGVPARNGPGETHRRRKSKIHGMTGSKQDNHASNPKHSRRIRAAEAWWERHPRE